jgi:hypothetical protein
MNPSITTRPAARAAASISPTCASEDGGEDQQGSEREPARSPG